MKNCNALILLMLVYGYIPASVSGFPSASFTGTDPDSTYYKACTRLSPQGHEVEAQTSTNPYTLTVSGGPWTFGQKLNLTLKSDTGKMFKGFIIQARNKADDSTMMGSFEVILGTKTNCGGLALTQDSSADKQDVQITWTAPSSGNESTVYFLYTIVQQKETFWVNQTSADIAFNTTMIEPTSGAAHVTLGSGLLLVILALFF